MCDGLEISAVVELNTAAPPPFQIALLDYSTAFIICQLTNQSVWKNGFNQEFVMYLKGER